MSLSPAPASVVEVAFAKSVQRARERRILRSKIDAWQDERDDLASFIPRVMRTSDGSPAIPAPHHRVIISAIADDSLGHTVVIAPPGSAKTNTMIGATAWWLGRNPTQHIGFFSNTDRQAYRRSVAIRDLVNSPLSTYRSIFPEVQADHGKGWAEFEWYLARPDISDKDATLTAAGAGSAILGSRLDRAALDDIADPKNQRTALQRERVIDWLKDVVMTRFTPDARAVMVCTRWHEADPAAWAIEQGWNRIVIPAIDAEGRSYWPEQWPIHKLACPDNEHGRADPGWEPSDRQPNPPCWVERDDEGNIKKQGNCAKFRLGTRMFNLTYQGITTDDASAIFKRTWWRRFPLAYDPSGRVRLPVVPSTGYVFVDMAHEVKTESDYSSIAIWFERRPNFYLAEQIRERLEFPDLVNRLLGLVGPGRPYYGMNVCIEETPGSKPLIQTLRRMVPGVIAWGIDGRDKMARANAVAPVVEAGNCYIPQNAPWVGDFVEEHAAFPNAEHDDMVDTTTMALLRFRRGGTMQTWS